MNNIYSIVNITIPANERVIIVDMNYVKKLFVLLDTTSARVLGKLTLFKPNVLTNFSYFDTFNIQQTTFTGALLMILQAIRISI